MTGSEKTPLQQAISEALAADPSAIDDHDWPDLHLIQWARILRMKARRDGDFTRAASEWLTMSTIGIPNLSTSPVEIQAIVAAAYLATKSGKLVGDDPTPEDEEDE